MWPLGLQPALIRYIYVEFDPGFLNERLVKQLTSSIIRRLSTELGVERVCVCVCFVLEKNKQANQISAEILS